MLKATDPELDDKDGEEREVKEIEDIVSNLDFREDGQEIDEEEEEKKEEEIEKELLGDETDEEDDSISIKHKVILI